MAEGGHSAWNSKENIAEITQSQQQPNNQECVGTIFSPLFSRLTKDFHCWSLLPLSLVGSINCVKMNVLPKFLYIFQSILIFILKSFFSH